MKRDKFFVKEAIVLLISTVLIFSTVIVTADYEEKNSEDLSSEIMGYASEPGIDVEKYVWDKYNQEWIDADTEAEALDTRTGTDITFKIVVHNDGNKQIENIEIKDKMHDSLKFISADPKPDYNAYEPPFYYLDWYYPGPLNPCETIEIYITANVEGPLCSIDYNYVFVEGDDSGQTITDEDYAYVHCGPRSRTINTPFLNWLENHLHMFHTLQMLFLRLGLY